MAFEIRNEDWNRIIQEFNLSGEEVSNWASTYGINPDILNEKLNERLETSKPVRVKRTRDEWRKLINQQIESGLGRTQWCRENGINESSLSSAVERIARLDSGSESRQCTPAKFIEATNKKTNTTLEHLHHCDDNVYANTPKIKISIGSVVIEAERGYPISDMLIIMQGANV